MKIRKKAYRDGIGILKKELRREKGIAFPLGWVPMPIEFAVASERERGIHVWHMPALTEIFGDDSVLHNIGFTTTKY